ncbi:MAG: ArgE/DapE family deacylase [Candidatus Korarchaeum sp.]|nr:ArgE/DapE family deacylase [Candidatus Korarchaeum sp.]MDW8034931.1 ArgE/DapE family deacylase [Candidatus Korarchaeum sp.]
MEVIFEAVRRKVYERRDAIVKLAKELVQIPSVTGDEREAQDFMRGKLREAGIKVETFEPNSEELKGHRSYFPTTSFIKRGYKNRPNVIGVIGEGERTLILNGHIDVVPPGPAEGWRYDPWSGEISDGKIYGRGAGDMKAGLAAMISAAEILLELDLLTEGKLLLESTIEEEDGGVGGALATLLRGYRGDFSINPEPTGLDFWVASAGVLYFKIRVRGRPSHTMEPHKGVSAIDKMFLIYRALKELDEERRKRVNFRYAEECDDRIKGFVTFLNIGVIAGGDWPSTIPSWAEVHCRIGWPPGETSREVEDQIIRRLEEVINEDIWLKENPPEYNPSGWRAEPSLLDPDNSYVRRLESIVARVTGRRPKYCGGTAGLDTRFFINDFNIPSVCFGPSAGNIHSFNEFVDIESLIKVTEAIAVFTLDFLNG